MLARKVLAAATRLLIGIQCLPINVSQVVLARYLFNHLLEIPGRVRKLSTKLAYTTLYFVLQEVEALHHKLMFVLL